MKTFLFSLLFAPACFAGAMFQGSNVVIKDPWARPSQTGNGAAYMMLENKDSKGDVVLSAESSICDRVELHAHVHEDGVMKMRPVENIEVNGEVGLKPGGHHLMLMGLKQPLKEGDAFPMTVNFANSGPVNLMVTVSNSANE